MNRIIPDDALYGKPCCITAVVCAAPNKNLANNLEFLPKRGEGYATLDAANKFIRTNLDVKKNTKYRRGERPLLKDLHLDGKAIVCVKGHYLYLDHETYYSFFDNEDDDVVSVWQLECNPLTQPQ
jgi:hypothetical protein